MRLGFILEDVPETRQWLTVLLQDAFEGISVQTASTVREGTQLVQGTVFDVALIDLSLPDGNGLDVLRSFRKASPEGAAIVTTVMSDDGYIVSALAAGADGYLLKEQPYEMLVRQLRELSSGIPALSPSVARRIMSHFRLTGPIESEEGDLTKRETEVLALIARGLRNSEAAAALGISENTVSGYIKTIYRKLGISSRAEASWHASRMGLNS
ncbi:response regulator [Shimia aestuarii]|uniref:response regulator n=1 Tax=Shimia aestuarii TaxID=254406 RepID=UPI001FB55C17|nr:response regulator transcription factor [Shimia aestuarii]